LTTGLMTKNHVHDTRMDTEDQVLVLYPLF